MIRHKEFRMAFMTAFLDTCVHIGGEDWRSQAAAVYQAVCELACPLWEQTQADRTTYNRYCRSAYLCAMTGMEFRLGHFSGKDIANAVALASADGGDGTHQEKTARHFHAIMAERQGKARAKLVAKDALVFELPKDDEGKDEIRHRFCTWVLDALSDDRMAAAAREWALGDVIRRFERLMVEVEELRGDLQNAAK